MEAFVTIVKYGIHDDAVVHVDKFQDFDTQAKADAHVVLVDGMGFKDAFVVPNPGGGVTYWVVDPVAKTVTNNQDQADADALASSWDRLRTERNAKLAESDWTQYNDSPLSDEVKSDWVVYRQVLRDLPTNTDDPANPTWPSLPG